MLSLLALGISIVAGAIVTSALTMVGADVVLGVTIGLVVVAPTIWSLLFFCPKCGDHAKLFEDATKRITFVPPSSLPFNVDVDSVHALVQYNNDGTVVSQVKVYVKVTPSSSVTLESLLQLHDDFIAQFQYTQLSDSSSVSENKVEHSVTMDDDGVKFTPSFIVTSLSPSLKFDTNKDWKDNLDNVVVVPWSYDPRAFDLTVLVYVVDPNTGRIKGSKVSKVALPMVKLTYTMSSSACSGCIFGGRIGSLNVYAIPVLAFGEKVIENAINGALTITLNEEVKEGDVVHVFVGSNAPLLNLKQYCNYNNDETCESLSDLLNNVCTVGYLMLPNVFKDFLEGLGYYNEDVVRIGSVIANVSSIVHSSKAIENVYVEGDAKVTITLFDGESYKTYEVKDGVNVNDENFVALDNGQSIQVSAKAKYYLSLSLPTPYSMYAKLVDTNNNVGYVLIDPLNDPFFNVNGLKLNCPSVVLLGNGRLVIPYVGGVCQLASSMLELENGELQCKAPSDLCNQFKNVVEVTSDIIATYARQNKLYVSVVDALLNALVKEKLQEA